MKFIKEISLAGVHGLDLTGKILHKANYADLTSDCWHGKNGECKKPKAYFETYCKPKNGEDCPLRHEPGKLPTLCDLC